MTAKPSNIDPTTRTDDPCAWLSALADGDAPMADSACAAWRDDPRARQTWHAYQLIGDVMRSDDLARPAASDAAFLAGLRERLAAEPPIVAPMPAPEAAAAPAARRHQWLVPMAAAAGFVVVAGVLVVTRVSQPGAEPAGGMAAAPAPTGLVLVRDEQLDEYLRAHRSARGGVAVGAPEGVMRRVDLSVPATPAR